MSVRIAVIDYGMGNLRSAEKALEHVEARAEITREATAIEAADGLLLPGVGAFPTAMRRIRELDLDELIAERAAAGVPILGICLGMELLFESSTEHGGADGLGLLAGEVTELARGPELKLPHIGWAPLHWQTASPLAEGIVDEPFYFVHSFAARAGDPEQVLATATYGERFPAVVGEHPVYGTQFHPEKSSAAGLRLLSNFATLCASVTAR